MAFELGMWLGKAIGRDDVFAGAMVRGGMGCW